MDINTMQTRAVNVQFGIGLTVLIRLVAVKTLISLVNFYIHQEIFFWGRCCGLRQIAANRTVAADVYGR